MTLGFPLKSFPLVPSCAFLVLRVVRSDTCVAVRSVGGWIDLLCVHMAVESDVSKGHEWRIGKTVYLSTRWIAGGLG